ncbi:MAG: GerW family sporulation protein [Butyricicoccus pullicaecorum]|nr:GerW family sporulation protein [Butyricicoccus pullicaecorum]
MSEHPIQNLMAETMEKIKSMVDVNTIIGSPIHTPDGTTIIPVSKVTFGFGAGGSDFQSRNAKDSAPLCFGGGGGAGVTVSPVCFLVVGSDGDARILPLNAQAETTADRLVEMIPGAVSKVSSFMESRRAAKADSSEAPQEDMPEA